MSLTISIINRTIGATDYLWNFGDGTTSVLAGPSHTYLAAGAYLVSLRATSGGGTNTFSKMIVVTGVAGPTEFLATPALDVLATSDGDALTLP